MRSEETSCHWRLCEKTNNIQPKLTDYIRSRTREKRPFQYTICKDFFLNIQHVMIQTRKKPYQYQEFLNYFIIKSKRNPDVKCHLNLKQYNCLMLMRRRRPHNPSEYLTP